MPLRMFAIIFCILWTAAILFWSDPLDVPMVAGVLTQLSLLAPSGDDFGGVKAQESESHQRGALATRL